MICSHDVSRLSPVGLWSYAFVLLSKSFQLITFYQEVLDTIAKLLTRHSAEIATEQRQAIDKFLLLPGFRGHVIPIAINMLHEMLPLFHELWRWRIATRAATAATGPAIAFEAVTSTLILVTPADVAQAGHAVTFFAVARVRPELHAQSKKLVVV